MSIWFKKNLGDAMLAGDSLEEIEGKFFSAYGNSGIPKDAAVFIRHESEGRLHCEVKAYFSSGADVVAKELGADLCERPSPDGLSLLVGSADAWRTLFPEDDG